MGKRTTNKAFGTFPVVRHRYVDMWALPGVHPTNIEFLQRLKSADDRQFGTNMDVCGSISEKDLKTGDWRQTHIVGIRTDIWNADKDELRSALHSLHQRRRDRHRHAIGKTSPLNVRRLRQLERNLEDDPLLSLGIDDVEKRRLALKLFKSTGKRIRWNGTIEEVTTREIHNSLGSRRALLSFVANVPGYEYLTIVQQNHRTFRIPSVFTFCFQDEVQLRMWYISIKRKWFSIGADFVIESEGRTIGEIDGKLISLGYDANITIHEPSLAKNSHFMDLITLFATSVGYHRAMRKGLRRRVREANSGESLRHLIEDEELWLLKNPRRHAA